jgi:hypothetical protein
VSDDWLQFVPELPTWQPTQEAASSAVALLRSFVPKSEAVKAGFSNDVEFFHPGENWSGVHCPRCDADAQGWWPEAMDDAWKNRFADLIVATPCCRAAVSLNDLRYVSNAGFGRFVLEAMNPDQDTTSEQELSLAKALGTPLKKIWVHI